MTSTEQTANPEGEGVVILVDADACPVKDEIYKVAFRTGVEVVVVANAFMRVPRDPQIRFVPVSEGPDVADDYIAERAGPKSVVVTSDIPLAERCLATGARVLSPKGKPFTPDSIGMAIATRAIMEEIRSTGEATGGPAPFQKADRSRFLAALDQAIFDLRRGR